MQAAMDRFDDGMAAQANAPAASAPSGEPEAAGAAPDNNDADQKASTSAADSVPVYVMLPLDTVNADGVFRYASSRWFNAALQQLKDTGIHGVAVDVWWGAVERRPRRYDWSGYRQLFELVRSLGLRLQVVLAFHACGGNVGDNAEVPLPAWVAAAGERDPDIFFTDRPREMSHGTRNRECVTFFADQEAGLLKGRSPLQCYVDFMRAFRDEFVADLGGVIEEVVVGCGPCGELRYPSYPEPNGWRFPGIGEFQCYDRRALASLASAAAAEGRPEWGNAGPHDAGSYNSTPEETGFFRSWGGRWDTDYGRFFLSWYSNALLDHGERMLRAAGLVFNVKGSARAAEMAAGPSGGDLLGAEGGSSNSALPSLAREGSGGSGPLPDSAAPSPREPAPMQLVADQSLFGPSDSGLSFPTATSRPGSYSSSLRSSSVSENLGSLEDWAWPSPAGPPVEVALKIAGVHWWYHTHCHAAELTAGYYNSEDRHGYEPLVALCARHGVCITLTCVEMCDAQHPPEALCGPEGLLRRVREAAAAAGVAVGGENALPCFMPNAIDEVALQRVVYNTQPWGTPLQQGDGEGNAGTSLGQLGPPPELFPGPEPASPTLSMQMQGPMGRASSANASPGPPPPSAVYSSPQLPPMRSFTFLRLSPDMMTADYQAIWGRFVRLMGRNAANFKTSARWRDTMGFRS